MNIALSRLTDIVSVILGEYPDWKMGAHGKFEAVSLSEMCEVMVEEIALRLTYDSPLEVFVDPCDFRSEIYLKGEFDDNSRCTVALPADFARIHSLKVPGWEMTLTDSKRGERKISALGDAAPEWMKRNPKYPRMEILSQSGEKRLMFSPAEKGFLEAACYIRKPAYDRESRTLKNLDSGLTIALCKNMAEYVKRERVDI